MAWSTSLLPETTLTFLSFTLGSNDWKHPTHPADFRRWPLTAKHNRRFESQSIRSKSPRAAEGTGKPHC